MKHRIKLWARAAYSRTLVHTGLARLVSRLMPPRLVILAGHCVREDAVNGGLPDDMKISAERLEKILRTLGRSSRLCTIGEGLEALEAGGARSLVALSMDDGYRDNLTALVPLLERTGARATVFLESRAVLERRVNWSHKLFWLLGEVDVLELTSRYMARSRDEATRRKLERAVAEPGAKTTYLVKRVLKYDAPRDERDELLDQLFREEGGDEAALCERIYLSSSEAAALGAAGVELGGHTVTHPVLSSLPPEDASLEVHAGRAALVGAFGEGAGQTFAYPFGRSWDFDQSSQEAVLQAGFRAAVTTHAGANTRSSSRTRLARWMIDEDTPIHLLVTEACGGFALLRYFGLELAE